MTGVLLSADLVLDRLGHLELRYKQAGAINEAGCIRLAILEVIRLAEEAKPKPPSQEIPPTLAHL